MKTNSKLIFIPLFLLMQLACTIFVGGPEYPSQALPVATVEADAMKTQIEQALLAAVDTGRVTIQISESQLTSFLSARMQALEDPPFTDPLVQLQDGQMRLYARVRSGIFTANVLIGMTVGIDPQTGLPTIEIASAEFGPIPAPEGLNSAVGSILKEAFTGTFGPVATGLRIESIAIDEGLMVITGRIK
jgi:hypothetical protein